MNCQKCRLFGAVLVLVQGLVTAAFPQLSAKFMQKLIGKNFDNSAGLEPTQAYLRQLRALGVGMVAAGGTHLLLESAQENETDSEPEEADTE